LLRRGATQQSNSRSAALKDLQTKKIRYAAMPRNGYACIKSGMTRQSSNITDDLCLLGTAMQLPDSTQFLQLVQLA
jgi:hypothetical protein